MQKWLFLASGRDPIAFFPKPSRAKIQPNWILQYVTLIESIGSVVFAWGPFKVELAARPIPILSPMLRIGYSKKKENLAYFFQIYLFILLFIYFIY